MAEWTSPARNRDERNARMRVEQRAQPPSQKHDASVAGQERPALTDSTHSGTRLSNSLLNSSALRGRGNASVQRAMILQMQQTHGNRATQRFLQKSGGRETGTASKISMPIAPQKAGVSSPVLGRMPRMQLQPVQKCGGEIHEGCACAHGSAGVDDSTAVPAQRQAFHGTRPPVQKARIPGTTPVVQRAVGGTSTSRPARSQSGGGSALTLSENGAKLIAEFEGVRLKLYNDPAGHCTIGIGHLVHMGNCNGREPAEFKRGITRAQAFNMLTRDASRFSAAVNRLVKVPLNQNQFDALVSFTYNMGEGALAESTLLRKLNAGNYGAVPDQLMRWVNAGGRPMAGLVRRRQAEADLFRSGTSEQRPGSGTSPSPPNQVALPTLKQGDRGAAVKRLQLRLNANGANVVADGVFGPKTHDAVTNFQRRRMLTADGIVGPKTWAALMGRTRPERPTSTRPGTKPKPGADVKDYPVLKVGCRGTWVRFLKNGLNAAGARPHISMNNGKFGKGTEQAVKDFQTRRKLDSDGVVGPKTWKVLNTVAPQAKPSTGSAFCPTQTADSPGPTSGVSSFDGKPVASWLVPYLKWARADGWRGGLSSGWRDPVYSEQLCYKICGRPSCPGRCAGRSSNHSGSVKPRGAIDVSDPSTFAEKMKKCPYSPKLFNALGAADPWHFSSTGR